MFGDLMLELTQRPRYGCNPRLNPSTARLAPNNTESPLHLGDIASQCRDIETTYASSGGATWDRGAWRFPAALLEEPCCLAACPT